jgi:hypothetical protein
MDYAPVQVGYWNCGFEEFVATSRNETPSTVDSSAGAAVDSSVINQMSTLGGQSRCPTCRCFESSLKEVSRIHLFNPRFPVFGMCYRCASRCCVLLLVCMACGGA